jgi:hypothetical protein
MNQQRRRNASAHQAAREKRLCDCLGGILGEGWRAYVLAMKAIEGSTGSK